MQAMLHFFVVDMVQVNSVGVYQLSKLMSIPVIAVMQLLIHRKTLELQTIVVSVMNDALPHVLPAWPLDSCAAAWAEPCFVFSHWQCSARVCYSRR